MRLCSWKNRKAVVAGLRRVYTAVNAETAAEALDELGNNKPLPGCYTNMAPPGKVHRAIHGSRQSFASSFTPPTSSKVSTINYEKSPKPRGHFPTDQSALKLLRLAARNITNKRGGNLGTGTHGWKTALNQLEIHFPNRLNLTR